MAADPMKELRQQAERLKALLHARVERPVHILKYRFGSSASICSASLIA